MTHLKFTFISTLILIMLTLFVYGAPEKDIPVTLTQPDGTVIDCFASGDEFFNYYHDINGYLIIQNSDTGYYTYTKLDYEGASSNGIAIDETNPQGAMIDDLQDYMDIYVEESKQERNNVMPISDDEPLCSKDFSGTINNIIVFVRFQGENEFVNSNYNDELKSMFNDSESSFKNYITEVTSGNVNLVNNFYPQKNGMVYSCELKQKRSYYKVYNPSTAPDGYKTDAEGSKRMRELAYNSIKSVIDISNMPSMVDVNNDGYVDNISIIVSGPSEGWNDVLWSHQWSIFGLDPIYISNKRVYNYYLIMNDRIDYDSTSDADISVGTVAHEFLHVLGLPDMYDYANQKRIPIGRFDAMANQTKIPMHPSAYTKNKWGLINSSGQSWVSGRLSTVTNRSGTYTLTSPVSKYGTIAYIIPKSMTGYNKDIYLEYRCTNGYFDCVNSTFRSYYNNGIPNAGLIIYEVDTTKRGNVNDAISGDRSGYAVNLVRNKNLTIFDQPLAFTGSTISLTAGQKISITNFTQNSNKTATFNLTVGNDSTERKITKVGDIPETVTNVPNGTLKNAAELGSYLPKTLSITTAYLDGTSLSSVAAYITWDYISCSYYPNQLTEQTFTIYGTVELPKDITNPDKLSLIKTVKMTVNGAASANVIRIDRITNTVTDIPAGTAKSDEGLGKYLPNSVTVYTTGTPSSMKADIIWNYYMINYNPSLTTQQTFSINGTVYLPTGVSNPNNISLAKTVTVTVKAGEKILLSINTLDNITGIVNGAQKTAEALSLPETVIIHTNQSQTDTASVIWNLYNIQYDPSSLQAQTFKVTGTVILPEGVSNKNNVMLYVTISVTVNAKTSTTLSVVSVNPPSIPYLKNVPNGLSKSIILQLLSKSTEIKLTNNTIVSAVIRWNLVNIVYNPSLKLEQKFNITGTVLLPQGIGNANNVNLNIIIPISVNKSQQSIKTFDLNSDGEINMLDLILLYTYIEQVNNTTETLYDINADINLDGYINIRDEQTLLKLIAGIKPNNP